MAQFHGLTMLAIASCALIALVASFLVTSERSSAPTLYCVADSTTQYITTLNALLPRAQCFRVQDGIFTEVLSSMPEAQAESVTYLDGHVLPGLIDSHGHILQYGEMLESVSLYGAESVAEVRTRIRDFLKNHQGEGYGSREKWVRGIGWDQKFFGGVMPTAAELAEDPALSDLYIMLDRVDVHCVLVSNKILRLLPNPLPKPPPGGVIIEDPGLGVFCDNAMDAVIYPLAPIPSVAQKSRWFKTAMASLNSVGIVGVGDAGMRSEDVEILQEMEEQGELTIRVNVMLECKERNTYCPEEVQDLNIVRKQENGIQQDGMLMLGGVKIFGDGALGSWGAAMLEPYEDKNTRGTMLINETELTRVVKNWYDSGFQVNVHAIGDLANRAVVDAFESVLGPNCNGCNSDRRLRIEHAQIIHPDDQKRIEKLGIIPSIQPTHATSDMAYALERLGPIRLSQHAYRMRSLFPQISSPDSWSYPGPVLGSDFPVEPPDPLHGMYSAVTRLNPATGSSPNGEEGWYREQEGLSVEQALKGFTINAAYGWNKDGKMGGVQTGMWADWVVVDKDLLAEDMSDGKGLRDVVVKETWTAGKKVFPVQNSEVSGEDWKSKFWSQIEMFATWMRGTDEL